MIRSLLGKKFPLSRLALTLGVGSSLLALGNASAQQVSDPVSAQAPETASSERIIVTGSNIPTAEEVGFSPVDTIDQARRDTTGQEDVLSVLTEGNPAISSGGGNLGSSNASISSGSTLGGSEISIHGLPTLVLLNGRRLTDASAAAAGGASFTDVNLFPSALVKRIEVLKDGASAIYGTEAVGGVVNVILDQEFQGAEFSTRYGFTEKSDVKNQRYSGIVGFGDDKTHFVIGAEYVNQDPLFDRDRNYSAISYGTTNFGGVARFSEGLYTLIPGVTSPNNLYAPGSQPLTSALPLAYQQNNLASHNFNLAAATDLTLDQNRLNVYASADRQLIGDKVVAFVDFLYASNYSQNYLNAQPLNESEGVVIPQGAPYNPFNGQLDGSNTGVATVNNRFVSNPRVFRNDADFYRIVAGLKGNIVQLNGSPVTYEVALNTSRDETTTKNPGLIVASDLNDAIAGGFDAAGNQVLANIRTNPDGTTTVVSPAGPYSMVRGNLQPALDFFATNNPSAALQNFTSDNIRYVLTKFAGVDGKVTAFPFNLPAGPIGVAAGGEYRHESLKLNDSPEIFVGSVPIGDIDVGRDVFALFSEAQVPLVSPSMKIPFLYKADLDGAFRYESFSTTGSTWVPKVGFTLQPIQDIAIRGSFSKSFIAPTLYDTNGPSSSGFTSSFTLPGDVASEQAQVVSGSNPNLSSTRADTYTAGIVLSPHQVPGLALNADFFHVEESRLIGAIDPVTALVSVNSLGTASPFSPFVHFGGVNGSTANGVGSIQGKADLFTVTSQTQNLGKQRIGGVDFGAHYNHDFGAFGGMSIGIDGTYYLQYKEETLKGTQAYDIIGIYNGQAGETEQYHLTPAVGYQIQGFSISAIGNYIPSMRDANSIGGVQIYDPTPAISGFNLDKQHELPKIRDYFTIDLLASYEFHYKEHVAPNPAPKEGKDGKGGGKSVIGGKETVMSTDSPLKLLDGLKFSFGITNLTNARPPQINDSPDSSNTDGSIYDLYQRQYYFVLTKKF